MLADYYFQHCLSQRPILFKSGLRVTVSRLASKFRWLRRVRSFDSDSIIVEILEYMFGKSFNGLKAITSAKGRLDSNIRSKLAVFYHSCICSKSWVELYLALKLFLSALLQAQTLFRLSGANALISNCRVFVKLNSACARKCKFKYYDFSNC